MKIHKLSPMLNLKRAFPMTYFMKNHALITLGGINRNAYYKEVTEYNLKRNIWRGLPCFPFEVYLSSICIMKNEWLYNLGGRRSKWNVGKLALTASGSAR